MVGVELLLQPPAAANVGDGAEDPGGPSASALPEVLNCMLQLVDAASLSPSRHPRVLRGATYALLHLVQPGSPARAVLRDSDLQEVLDRCLGLLVSDGVRAGLRMFSSAPGRRGGGRLLGGFKHAHTTRS